MNILIFYIIFTCCYNPSKDNNSMSNETLFDKKTEHTTESDMEYCLSLEFPGLIDFDSSNELKNRDENVYLCVLKKVNLIESEYLSDLLNVNKILSKSEITENDKNTLLEFLNYETKPYSLFLKKIILLGCSWEKDVYKLGCDEGIKHLKNVISPSLEQARPFVLDKLKAFQKKSK